MLAALIAAGFLTGLALGWLMGARHHGGRFVYLEWRTGSDDASTVPPGADSPPSAPGDRGGPTDPA